MRCDGFNATNLRSSVPKPCGFSTPRTRMPRRAYVDTPSRGVTLGAFICGSFSSDPLAINRIILRSYQSIFFQKKKATLRSSWCRPTSPIHRARHPIRDAAGRGTEGGAQGEWARYRLGSYTIIDRQYLEVDFHEKGCIYKNAYY